MKALLSIVTCHALKYIERANAQRQTWINDIKGRIDYKFFLGQPPLIGNAPRADEIFLDAEDGYKSMPAKVRAMFRWALENGYDLAFKTDDDCYVNIDELLRCPVSPYDYVGRFRGPSGDYLADYASGYGYWLSRKAMEIIANAALTEDWAEDRWVANTLAKAGIQGYSDDHHYVACYPPVMPEMVFSGGLRSCAVFCEYPPHLMRKMYQMHKAYNPPPMRSVKLNPIPLPKSVAVQVPVAKEIIIERKPLANLSSICVLLKTFLRDGLLFDTVSEIEKYFPELRMIIIDDGRQTPIKNSLYERLRKLGHTCAYMPFDSGFGAKANTAIQFFDRPYVLIGADDFDFSDENQVVRHGIERMLSVISGLPDVGVASGRVDNNPYEGFLSYGPDFIKETPLKMGDWQYSNGVEFKYCDLTVNYSLIRKSVFDTGVLWKDIFKIGSEHFWFFYDVKNAGWKTAFVPGANISQKRYDPAKIDPSYLQYRNRAWDSVGKFVKMWVAERKESFPEQFIYEGFDGEKSDYVAIARKRGLL